MELMIQRALLANSVHLVATDYFSPTSDPFDLLKYKADD